MSITSKLGVSKNFCTNPVGITCYVASPKDMPYPDLEINLVDLETSTFLTFSYSIVSKPSLSWKLEVYLTTKVPIN